MILKMAVQIVIRAPYESVHQICICHGGKSLNLSRWPSWLLVTRLHLFESNITGALCPLGASTSMPLSLPPSGYWLGHGARVTHCSEIG